MPERIAPLTIDVSLKEAVSEALLGHVFQRISGGGEPGRTLYRVKPKDQLVSGFLLPPSKDADLDETRRNIVITSHGLRLRLRKGSPGIMKLQVQASAYVRMLPTVEDLARPGMRPAPVLHREAQRAMRDWVRGQLAEAGDGPDLRSRDERAMHLRETWLRDQGVPRALFPHVSLNELDAGPDAEAAPTDTEAAPPAPEAAGLVDAARVNALFEAMPVPHRWERVDLVLPEIELDLGHPGAWSKASADFSVLLKARVAAALAAWSAAPEQAGRVFRTGLRCQATDLLDWPRFLERSAHSDLPLALPPLDPVLTCRVADDWQVDGQANLTLVIENQTPLPPARERESYDPALFNLRLTVTLPDTAHVPLPMSRVKRSYAVERFLDYPAMGFNGGVERLPASPGELRLRTTWSPRFHQPRMRARDHGNINRSFRHLSKADGHKSLQSLPQAYADWIREVDAGFDRSPERLKDARHRAELEAFERDRDLGWQREMEGIRDGLALLDRSRAHWSGRGPQQDVRGAPYEAWLAMNEAMADMMKDKLKNDGGAWRLFQVAFILANLPSLVTRMTEFMADFQRNRDEAVTLLYFATGGGKSEAFLGLLLFNLFLDRLRGKTFGVTAMMRYPLRLLTMQQAVRTAKAMAFAETIRTRMAYPGEPFAIGFWVGSAGTPNRLSAPEVQHIPYLEDIGVAPVPTEQRDHYVLVDAAWRKLTQCPFCKAETVLRRVRATGGTLAHVCTRKTCSSHGGGPYKALPFYICDEDIYAFAPSVLLGTVDKLALIGHSPGTIQRLFSMFGAAATRDPATGRLAPPRVRGAGSQEATDEEGLCRLAPAYPSGTPLFHDPFPSMLIQDEAHLLDESLGTFAGLFETLFEAMLDRLGSTRLSSARMALAPDGLRRRAKVIAASATVAQPDRQMEHLYQRSTPTVRFPHPGPDIYRSFYAEPLLRKDGAMPDTQGAPDLEEHRANWSRIYIAFLTNGRPHTTTTVTILGHFHRTITACYDGLMQGDLDGVKALLRASLDPDSPNGAQFDALLAAADASRLLTLVDLHRIGLTYVTNKKGGDQVQSAEAPEAQRLHAYESADYQPMPTRLITSEVEQGEIQAIIEEAQRRVEPGQPFPPLAGQMRSIIATSAVSHGVDVDEFNSMFFAGMPSDIAEYIQASSRVGRTHAGFCVLIPTPQQRRDRYIVEVFDGFHRFLERMVQPAAIDRWAEQAIERSLPSMIMGYLAGVRPLMNFLALEDDKTRWQSDGRVADILRSHGAQPLAFRRAMEEFLAEAIGLEHGFEPAAEPHYRALIHNAVEELIHDMGMDQHRTSLFHSYMSTQPLGHAPMTSLRDVDTGGMIVKAHHDYRTPSLKDADVRALMRLIREGH